MKHAITTSATLETAVVMLTIVPVNDDWWEWTCLDALHLWADFDPEPPFQQLTLSFVIPHTSHFRSPISIYDEGSGFERKMGSIVGPHGNQQLLSHIILGKVLIKYVYVYDDIIWEESLSIRRRVVDHSIGRVYWRTWDPFDSERL